MVVLCQKVNYVVVVLVHRAEGGRLGQLGHNLENQFRNGRGEGRKRGGQKERERERWREIKKGRKIKRVIERRRET